MTLNGTFTRKARKKAVGRQISNEAAKQVYRDATRASWIGLFANLLLGVTKLVGGLLSSSFALISDAVNSLGDVLTNASVLFALHLAQKPADAEHPYGHTRAEAIAASNVSLLVVVSALWVAGEALLRLSVEHGIPPLWALWIAGGNVVIKEALYRYNIKVAKATGSGVIVASAWDHRADAFSALAALIGLAIVRFGGQSYLWADEVAALVIVGLIIASAFRVFRDSASELMDAQAEPELVEELKKDALTVEGVRGVETLWVRKSGLEYLADIHLEVDPDLSVKQGHSISHVLRDYLLEKHPCLRDVLVHLEPFRGDSSET